MNCSPQVLDSVAETQGYFLACDRESVSLADAAALAAFLFFGPMWVSSGKLLFDHNWKRKREKKPKPKPTDQICRMGLNHRIQFSAPTACMISAQRCRRSPRSGHRQQSPNLSQAGNSSPTGRAMNATSQIPEETPGFVLSGCLEKLFAELNTFLQPQNTSLGKRNHLPGLGLTQKEISPRWNDI